MFELTNEQRKCFGLRPVEDHWQRLEPKPSPYHQHATVAYLDGSTLRKLIQTGPNLYTETEICEELSEDRKYLMPKTAKGKPQLLSAATLEKRTPLGMGFSWNRSRSGFTDICLFSHTSQRNYYTNCYDPHYSFGEDDLAHWVDAWCADTTPEDLLDITRFAALPRQRVKFREGDVFRFQLTRRLWGYGRIVLDYAMMRKKKIPFWDVLAGKPAACSIYCIVTDRSDVTVEELKNLNSLPSTHMMDNHLFYGEYEIIGHIPIGEQEDYPIMYGASISALYRGTHLQCGKLFRLIENEPALYNQFMNHAIGFAPRFTLPVLEACIQSGTNEPFWKQRWYRVHKDLRDPSNRKELEEVCSQFGITPQDLIKE